MGWIYDREKIGEQNLLLFCVCVFCVFCLCVCVCVCVCVSGGFGWLVSPLDTGPDHLTHILFYCFGGWEWWWVTGHVSVVKYWFEKTLPAWRYVPTSGEKKAKNERKKDDRNDETWHDMIFEIGVDERLLCFLFLCVLVFGRFGMLVDLFFSMCGLFFVFFLLILLFSFFSNTFCVFTPSLIENLPMLF